ncbi:MAG: flagellar biosynthetic protein FliO [Deltaproteobacteria bacterium]|nr:flagellar biosynthetic protein FliO [Deltaproteobacteria bacterium]
MKLLISAAVLATASRAFAGAPEPSFELVERGDAVEVIARNVKAARTAINPVRSRLEVEVANRPRAKALVPAAGHKPVVIVELDGEPRSLSVKLQYSYAETKAMARFAQAIQVGDDLHLMFPRTLPAEGASVVLPEPTLPPELAAKIAAPKAETKPEVKPAALETRPSAPMPTPAPAPAPAVTAAPAAPAPALELPKDTGGGLSNLSLYALCGAGAIALGAWLVKRKKTAPPASTIEVIAQRALSGKAKMVWLSVGQREMVVAVTQQQVRMLGQWPKGQQPQHADGPQSYASIHQAELGAAELPMAQVVDGNRSSDPSKSSVAGLMKLRARTSSQTVSRMNEDQAASILQRARTSSRVLARPQVNEDVATGDELADEIWAREIVAATGARR